MTTAEERYCGDAGTQYWQRNQARLNRDRTARRTALRSLVDAETGTARWLEVGCGQGHNLYALDVGLDCDRRQLTQMVCGALPLVGHAYDLNIFPDKTFPVVLSVGCWMHLPDGLWQQAAAEAARVSSRYVMCGEYWAETEEPITGHHWDGALWRRPYIVPGMMLQKMVQPLPPFDDDVTFSVWTK